MTEREFSKLRRRYVELRRKWRAPIARFILTGRTRKPS